jgi:hypothetical protein
MSKPTMPLINVAVPSSEMIRKQLAVNVTAAGILRQLLRVALRREREEERLSRLLQRGGPDHAA